MMEATSSTQGVLLVNSSYVTATESKEDVAEDAAESGQSIMGVDINGACVNSTGKVPNSGLAVDSSNVTGKQEGKIHQHHASGVKSAVGEGDGCLNGSKSVSRPPGPSGNPQSAPDSPEGLSPKCRSDERSDPSPGTVDPSLKEQNEEQIRSKAQRHLDEQLKQYRVQRHQQRSKQSTPKINAPVLWTQS